MDQAISVRQEKECQVMVQALAERELTLNLEAAGCDEALIHAFLSS